MRFIAGAGVCAFALLAQQQGASPQKGPRKGGGGFGGVAPLEEKGFRPIFDGTMKDWDGDPNFWKVADGILTGETTAEHQPPQNIFCIWRGGKPADFELKMQY